MEGNTFKPGDKVRRSGSLSKRIYTVNSVNDLYISLRNDKGSLIIDEYADTEYFHYSNFELINDKRYLLTFDDGKSIIVSDIKNIPKETWFTVKEV